MAFFAEGADAEEARVAGADIVGGVELIEEIASKNWSYWVSFLLFVKILFHSCTCNWLHELIFS